jgi:hypothetical protein
MTRYLVTIPITATSDATVEVLEDLVIQYATNGGLRYPVAVGHSTPVTHEDGTRSLRVQIESDTPAEYDARSAELRIFTPEGARKLRDAGLVFIPEADPQ